MRDKLARLSTVRALRAKQRRREYVAAQAEMARKEREVAERTQELGATREALAQAKTPLHSAGASLNAAEIERLRRLAGQYEGAMLHAQRDIIRAQKARDAFRPELDARRAAMRAAESAVEQLAMVDERLAVEEARLAELQDELQSETPPKPRWSAP